MATQKLRRSDIKKEIKRINFLKNNCPCFGGNKKRMPGSKFIGMVEHGKIRKIFNAT